MYKIETFEENLRNEIYEIGKTIGLIPQQIEEYFKNYFFEFKEKEQYLKVLPFRLNNSLKNTHYHELLDKLISKNEQGIVFGTNGTVFHANSSPAKDFLKLMLGRRKIAKKKMLQAKEEGDKAKVNLYDTQQLKFKESANSLFGLLNLSAFFLYDSDCANAITSASRTQAYYIINNFECTIGSRFIFETFADVILFLHRNDIRYISEQIKIEEKELKESADRDLTFQFLETPEEFLEKIKSGFQFNFTEKEHFLLIEIIKEIFLNENNRYRYSLMGKMKQVFINSNTINNSLAFDHFPSNSEFNEKEWHNYCHDLFVISSFSSLYSLPESERISKNYKRTTTVLSDTDSTYNKYFNLFHYIINHKDAIKFSLEEKESIAFRLVDIIGKTITDASLRQLNKQLLKSEEDVNSWKSEFAFRSIIIPSTKKTYAYHAVVQEGVKVDIKENKGFFKSGFSEFSNKFIVELIDAIFESEHDKIFSHIFKKFSEGKRILETDIKKGGFKAYSRLKYGHASRYESPWSQYQYVAGAINNLLFNEEKALSGERVAFLKLKMPNVSQKNENREEEYLKFIEENSTNEFVAKLRKALDENQEFRNWFSKDGLKNIGIPTALKKIPEELIPLIDTNIIISENLFSRTGNFLELLGIESGKGSKDVYGGGCLEMEEYL